MSSNTHKLQVRFHHKVREASAKRTSFPYLVVKAAAVTNRLYKQLVPLLKAGS
ncbi:MAG: hypothetical protein PHX94_01820 [Bacteroidales bacterium]|nr:hypothetical protein [Bacteroidales bacterium]